MSLLDVGEVMGFPLAPSVRITKGIGSGLLPTLTATDANGRTWHGGPRGETSLALLGVLRLLPTLCASDYRAGYRSDSTRGNLQRSKRAKPLRDLIAPGGQINPQWALWFIGFPENWLGTALNQSEPSAIPLSRSSCD
ncbi:MAG: hypothetical protein HQL97_16555 [Magnetococcales bacterium]|nr:hypothetical protein [Magnetococcales bacterium]